MITRVNICTISELRATENIPDGVWFCVPDDTLDKDKEFLREAAVEQIMLGRFPQKRPPFPFRLSRLSMADKDFCYDNQVMTLHGHGPHAYIMHSVVRLTGSVDLSVQTACTVFEVLRTYKRALGEAENDPGATPKIMHQAHLSIQGALLRNQPSPTREIYVGANSLHIQTSTLSVTFTAAEALTAYKNMTTAFL